MIQVGMIVNTRARKKRVLGKVVGERVVILLELKWLLIIICEMIQM